MNPDKREFVIYHRRISKHRNLKLTLLNTAYERYTLDDDPHFYNGAVTNCPDHTVPGCEVRLDLEEPTESDRGTSAPTTLEEQIKTLGDRVLFLDFRGTKQWSWGNRALMTAFERALEGLNFYSAFRCSADSSGKMRVDIRDGEYERPSRMDPMMSDSNNFAPTIAPVPGITNISVDMRKLIDLKTAVHETLGLLALHRMTSDPGPTESPVTGIMILTDTAPEERSVPGFLEGVKIRVYGIWTGVDEKNVAEHQKNNRDGELIPKQAFEESLESWDKDAVLLTPNFLGLSSLPESGDAPRVWSTIEITPVEGWTILTAPAGGASDENLRKLEGSYRLKVVSSACSTTFVVVPERALNYVPKDDDHDSDPAEVFMSLIPSSTPTQKQKLFYMAISGAGDKKVSISTTLRYKPPKRQHVDIVKEEPGEADMEVDSDYAPDAVESSTKKGGNKYQDAKGKPKPKEGAEKKEPRKPPKAKADSFSQAKPDAKQKSLDMFKK